jgi:hypothetical protein
LVVPPSGQKTQDETVLSNSSSNRLKEATLNRRSFDSHRNRESFRSYSFVLQTNLENLGQPETNYAPGTLSPEMMPAPSRELTSEKGGATERPQSCTLRVIKEVIINGKGEDEENAPDQASVVEDGSKEAENNRYREYMPTLDMNKVNMTFD